MKTVKAGSKADLIQQIAELRFEIAALRDQINAAPSISYSLSVGPQGPISDPIDFRQIGRDLTNEYSFYSEADDWTSRSHVYL